MIDKKYLELIQGEIDNANSPEQSAKLKDYLATHTEAQRLYDELEGMAAMLQEVKPVEPPPHLQQLIMNLLPPQRSAVGERRNIVAAIKDWLPHPFRPAYFFAFAGGAAATVLLFALFSPLVFKNDVAVWSKLYGTIGTPRSEQGAPGAERWEINQAEVTGALSLQFVDASLVVAVALDSPQSLDIIVSFDEHLLGFKSFVRLEETLPAEIALDRGSIRLTHRGRQSYTLVFARHTAAVPAISFKILAGGRLLYENILGKK